MARQTKTKLPATVTAVFKGDVEDDGDLGETMKHGRTLAVDRVREADPAGRATEHLRMSDTLGTLLRNKVIDHDMYLAGEDFGAWFALAALDPMRCASLERIPGAGARDLTEKQIDARFAISECLRAVGGSRSPAGSALWYVAGCRWSLRYWAMQQGWNGRKVNQHEARGILIAALGMLCEHLRRRH